MKLTLQSVSKFDLQPGYQVHQAGSYSLMYTKNKLRIFNSTTKEITKIECGGDSITQAQISHQGLVIVVKQTERTPQKPRIYLLEVYKPYQAVAKIIQLEQAEPTAFLVQSDFLCFGIKQKVINNQQYLICVRQLDQGQSWQFEVGSQVDKLFRLNGELCAQLDDGTLLVIQDIKNFKSKQFKTQNVADVSRFSTKDEWTCHEYLVVFHKQADITVFDYTSGDTQCQIQCDLKSANVWNVRKCTYVVTGVDESGIEVVQLRQILGDLKTVTLFTLQQDLFLVQSLHSSDCTPLVVVTVQNTIHLYQAQSDDDLSALQIAQNLDNNQFQKLGLVNDIVVANDTAIMEKITKKILPQIKFLLQQCELSLSTQCQDKFEIIQNCNNIQDQIVDQLIVLRSLLKRKLNNSVVNKLSVGRQRNQDQCDIQLVETWIQKFEKLQMIVRCLVAVVQSDLVQFRLQNQPQTVMYQVIQVSQVIQLDCLEDLLCLLDTNTAGMFILQYIMIQQGKSEKIMQNYQAVEHACMFDQWVQGQINAQQDQVWCWVNSILSFKFLPLPITLLETLIQRGMVQIAMRIVHTLNVQMMIERSSTQDVDKFLKLAFDLFQGLKKQNLWFEYLKNVESQLLSQHEQSYQQILAASNHEFQICYSRYQKQFYEHHLPPNQVHAWALWLRNFERASQMNHNTTDFNELRLQSAQILNLPVDGHQQADENMTFIPVKQKLLCEVVFDFSDSSEEENNQQVFASYSILNQQQEIQQQPKLISQQSSHRSMSFYPDQQQSIHSEVDPQTNLLVDQSMEERQDVIDDQVVDEDYEEVCFKMDQQQNQIQSEQLVVENQNQFVSPFVEKQESDDQLDQQSSEQVKHKRQSRQPGHKVLRDQHGKFMSPNRQLRSSDKNKEVKESSKEPIVTRSKAKKFNTYT